MIKVRRSDERGFFDHGWLKTYHTFSFADYHDPKWIHFRHLRVINEDFVQPADGFDMHPHRDMEIITYILSGSLEHKDSMGNGSVIKPGEIQYMSAGSGVTHSEFNPSKNEQVHLLQIWILPAIKGAEPRYGQLQFDPEKLKGLWVKLVSGQAQKNVIEIRQDVDLFASRPLKNKTQSYVFKEGRSGFLHVARGTITSNGLDLSAGDALLITDENKLELSAQSDDAEVLLFDLN